MSKEKYLIFDSGALINFSTNSLLNVVRQLKKIFPGEFLVTGKIIYETIEYPLKVKRFEWGALRVQELLEEGVLKKAENYAIPPDILKKETAKILDTTNSIFTARGRAIHIIDEGEAEILALSRYLTKNKKPNAVVIDERTARVLCEKPENLQKILQKKLHAGVQANNENLSQFEGFRVIRSTELAYIAYKKGLIQVKGSQALEAVIYALKFGGCSISDNEVRKYAQMR